MRFEFYNEDCVSGSRRHIPDDSIDLIITDPPYGINGADLHKHYNRKEDFVVDGYVEVPKEEYADFSERWIREAARILRPGGTIYVISGYTNLHHVLNALHGSGLNEINHIIWKYNFGVHTRAKYVSSHYHILYWMKPGAKAKFNTLSRFGPNERDSKGGSLNYQDREDVWILNREYKPGKAKNKNELPKALLTKMIQYSSDPGDTVCDLFLGGFSTAWVAKGLNRNAVGFELSKSAFNLGMKRMETVACGGLLDDVRSPVVEVVRNQGKRWTDGDVESLKARVLELKTQGHSLSGAVTILKDEFGRGRFSIGNAIEKNELWDRPANESRPPRLEDFGRE